MAYDRQHHRTCSPACGRGTQGQRGADAQGLGRPRGGLSAKIHAATEALGLPVRLIASPGQRNDIAFAHDLIDGIEADALLADKGYDAEIYKERNRIQRFFNKLKQFRRVATRYDKLLANLMGFVKLAAIAIWIK
ncbi:transposase [Brucellaceae bacterium D45D]